ncbi:MAG: T9SS type A sorting domain-containing protein [Bacteroidales bacterium]|nr:T9SS type A sorting domain-containing protein [Bacteroidales bacterium]
MRKIYKTMMIVAVAFIAVLAVSAQETRIIKVDGWDPTSGEPDSIYNNVLYEAIEADTTARKTNPNVIFELTRGHKYPQGKIIKNYDYHLHIRAAEGDGLQPELIPGKRTNGAYKRDYINSFNDLTLQNITFNGYTPDGQYNNRMVEAKGPGQRYVIEGCIFDGDRGAGIVIRADSMKVYVKDVIVGNCGHRKTTGGNGRIVDMRPEALWVDTLIIQNSTVNNASDRIIRNMGSEVGYLEIDHLTALNTVGWHGGVQLGYVHTAKVTNSLFANTISCGHTESRTKEQTQPEKHFAVISLDTVFDGQVLEIRNNNIYWDQEIIDVWAKYDTVEAPWPITPTIETALGDAASEAYFTEPLAMTTTCGPISAYVDALYANPEAGEFPENWCVGGEGGYFLDEADLSYPTESVSYTSADGGYPVGNLNYFPELKAQWETGVGVGIETLFNKTNSNLRNYPNPFNNTTIIAFELENSSNISLEVYDITGRMVRSLVSEFRTAGSHEVNFDAAGIPGGMYFYKLDNGYRVQVNNMIISK